MRRFFKIAGIAVLAFVILVVAAILFMPTGWVGRFIGERGSAQLGRQVSVGAVRIHWDWTRPILTLDDVRVANMPGASAADMVDIGRADITVRIWHLLEGQLDLPEVKLVNPKILLEKLGADKENWKFPAFSKVAVATHAVVPTNRHNMPIIGRLIVNKGQITYRDKPDNLDTTLDIDTVTGSNGQSLKLSGQGTLQGQTFNIEAGGGSLAMLRKSSKDYPLDIDIRMGKTAVKVAGVFHDPIKMEGVDTQLDIHGDDLADLFYLTGIPLPPSPPYSLSGHLQEQKDVWTFNGFKGRIGESDLEGDLSYDTSGPRNYMKAALASNLLRMKDLAGFIGLKERTAPQPKNQVLPDMPINLGRLRAADMDVDFKAAHINQPGWPIDNMNTHFHLKDGVLTIDPLSFGVAQGTISGTLALDGRQDVPKVGMDLVFEGLSLKPFFASPHFASLSQGHFGGRMQVEGTGKSLAEVMGDSNGRIALMMSGGTISRLIVDAMGLDVRAAPELLGKDKQTDIRCAILDFRGQNGVFASDIFDLDTTASNIRGSVKVDFKDQTIDARIEGHPKELTLSGQIPITVTGSLASPAIGLGAKTAIVRGAAAAALSILTPVASIIPFIHIDLGKDSNCKALIGTAAQNAHVTPQAVTKPSH